MADAANVAGTIVKNKPKIKAQKGLRYFVRKSIEQKELLLMSMPFLIWLFIFKYLPLSGWLMAFQDYKPARGFQESEFVGFDQFKFLFQDDRFLQVMRNTLAMSMINLVLGFVTAITLAILLNELRNVGFKRIVQTISYMPHFLSWVVVAGLVSSALSVDDGIINILLMNLGIIDEPIMFLGVGQYFWGLLGASEVWKSVGWNSIIYLAAITMIDQEQYEAAEIDGATRLQRIFYITLPGIKPVVVILMIMNIGYILESGFEAQYLLMNPMNMDYAENLDIFVLRYGLRQANFSLATAAGMFKTVISFIFLFAANKVAHKLGEARLF
ncbi:sugar ABC transporter permease [Halolactibacillus alkaliphilus]|uniref:Sugar ABC transporter permease n=1 Tax=Halolactibacillus alkaliphilus TaxID=442899 RepID=A0A511X040_9BACI|nr:sugar ABC transporter permease [Halolactibacillus alkaliphilus]GEN56317.1 sugar ABC transporter permease [Halolactibacillus alkaliphilus]GGN67709.1 sugar ABC transporter permease [Halolactibacillus alkaliphilus]SFO79081.1 aldotetraouronic acid ABC transporter membrane protein 1 [Halolactibacillus alkaliphilus]